jgi:murein DD-endopeptidase MepM/ murein hydrolase activator NlpD
MVEPSEEDLARIKADAEAIAKARARDSAEPLWDTEWRWPVVGRISGVFGSQRILNGQPRRPHYGVDVAMPTGTPVVAPADGVVSLAHGDMYFTGGTVILDHGHGVGSLYAHLSAVDVAEGTRLRKGERLGAIGATGRATGPHLHWGMTWYALNVDPALVVPPMPAP